MLQSSSGDEVGEKEVVSPSTSIDSVWEGDGYQYITSSDEEIVEIVEISGWIKYPSRTGILTLLSSDYRRRLREYVTQPITENEAMPCLTIERFNFVPETHPVPESYFMSDSDGYLFLYWLTQGPGNEYIVEEEIRRILKLVGGPIRDQMKHLICWAYAVCDLISSCRVLHGLDKEFLLLSPMFLCRNVYQKEYTEKCKAENDEEHYCLGGCILKGLMYAKTYGIPREKPEERVFDCRMSNEFRDEEHYKISEVFAYETLELTLKRVKTGYPVAASLICFEGWDTRWEHNDQPTYIYHGPKSGGKYLRTHAVIITDFKIINGIKVPICKSSNGEGNHNRGYMAVNVEIMITVVGATKRKGNTNWCKKKPQYLLDGFFSIDMEMGPEPLIKVEPDRAKENMQFKVETDCVGPLLAPKYQSPITNSCSVSMEKPESLVSFGSAGGYTTLEAFACEDVIKAGTSLYGIADLKMLKEEGHKVESCYIDNLVGDEISPIKLCPDRPRLQATTTIHPSALPNSEKSTSIVAIETKR